MDDLEAPTSVVGKLAMNKNPRAFGEKLADRGFRKRVVGFDFGNNMGVAYADVDPNDPSADVNIVLGQWDLSVGPFDTGPLRMIRLEQYLTQLRPDLIFCEDVKYSPPMQQFKEKFSIQAVISRVSTAAELLGAFKWQTATWAAKYGIPLQAVAIGTIKKYATGKGVADKVAMIEACNTKFGTKLDPSTYQETGADNMADAAFLCCMAVETYYEGLNYAEGRNEDSHAAGGVPGGEGDPGSTGGGGVPARRSRRGQPRAGGKGSGRASGDEAVPQEDVPDAGCVS